MERRRGVDIGSTFAVEAPARLDAAWLYDLMRTYALPEARRRLAADLADPADDPDT